MIKLIVEKKNSQSISFIKNFKLQITIGLMIQTFLKKSFKMRSFSQILLLYISTHLKV